MAVMQNRRLVDVENGLPSSFRHIVITGASSGLGAALARHYARGRPILSLLGRDTARIGAVADECIAAGAQAFPRTGDVTDAKFVADWLMDCDARSPVDFVIANAGVGGSFAMPREGPETAAVAETIFATNIVGVTNTILPIIPRLMERRCGRLVLMSSLAAYIGLPDAPAYSASKAAVRTYGHGLRRLLAPYGVGVSVVCPGFVQTPMSESIPHPLPFLWDSSRAARHIAARVARGQGEIAFPWQLSILAGVAAMLPAPILDFALHHFRIGKLSS
jgi:short-subunit dehydrogenase